MYLVGFIHSFAEVASHRSYTDCAPSSKNLNITLTIILSAELTAFVNQFPESVFVYTEEVCNTEKRIEKVGTA